MGESYESRKSSLVALEVGTDDPRDNGLAPQRASLPRSRTQSSEQPNFPYSRCMGSRVSIPVSRNWKTTAKARIYMSDFFTSLAHVHWPKLWFSIFFCYVVSWGFWAITLFLMNSYLDKGSNPDCLAHSEGFAKTKFADYYFFAVETMTTIGFGAYHLQCRWMNLMVSFMSLHSDFLHATMFGVVLAKISMPGKRGSSIFMSDMLCGHISSGTIAFRLINARKHAVYEPSIKVFLVSPRLGDAPDIQKLSPKLAIPMEFLELPQIVSVHVGDHEDWRSNYVVAIFSATDGVTGSTFEVRKRWSLRKDVSCGCEFAPMLDDGGIDKVFALETSLNMHRFHDLVKADPSCAPAWAREDRSLV